MNELEIATRYLRRDVRTTMTDCERVSRGDLMLLRALDPFVDEIQARAPESLWKQAVGKVEGDSD